MSKRFTDTQLWDKEWFHVLTPAEKTAFFYVKDRCDAVGVWSPNYALAEFVIGTAIDWKSLPGKCNGNVEVLRNGKWFLPDFCLFQYGELSEDCKPHRSYLGLLGKHDIKNQRVSEGYPKGSRTLQEKEKEKDKEKDKTSDTGTLSIQQAFQLFYSEYPVKKAKAKAIESFKRAVKSFDSPAQAAEVMIGAIRKQIENRKLLLQSKRFVPEHPFPATWINQQRWEDEYEREPGNFPTVDSTDEYRRAIGLPTEPGEG